MRLQHHPRACTCPAACCLPHAGALNNAITCTILAAAGPQRSRMLSQLYKDERSASLPVFPFLEKVYLERILRRWVAAEACAADS